MGCLHDNNFSTRLREGNVSTTSYIQYLKFYREVFDAIESENDIDPRLCRVEKIDQDLKTFGSYADDVLTPPMAKPYADYILGCDEWRDEQINAHIRLNYGTILGDSRRVNNTLPYSKNIYLFMNRDYLTRYIDTLGYDSSQAFTGMKYHLNLYKYLKGPLDDETILDWL